MMGFHNRALPRFRRAFLALVCIFLCGEIAAARDVAVVTCRSNRVPVGMKSSDLIKTMKSTHKWPGGSDLTVILTNPSSSEIRIVAEKLLSLTVGEFKEMIDEANKIRVTFLVVSSDDEVLKTVESNPSAIGLVNVYSITSNVDVLKIDDKLPLQTGYILHSQ